MSTIDSLDTSAFTEPSAIGIDVRQVAFVRPFRIEQAVLGVLVVDVALGSSNWPASEQSPTEWKWMPCQPGVSPPGLIVMRTTVAFSLERIASLPIGVPFAPTMAAS